MTGAKGSKRKPEVDARQPRRRSSRIATKAQREDEDMEIDTSEVEVLDSDVEVKTTIKESGILNNKDESTFGNYEEGGARTNQEVGAVTVAEEDDSSATKSGHLEISDDEVKVEDVKKNLRRNWVQRAITMEVDSKEFGLSAAMAKEESEEEDEDDVEDKEPTDCRIPVVESLEIKVKKVDNKVVSDAKDNHKIMSEECCSTTSLQVMGKQPSSRLTSMHNMVPDLVDSETEMEESLAETCSTLLGTRPGMVARNTQIATAGLAGGVSDAVCDRMKTVFKSGLAIHFSGEEMEACLAVNTSLFPHQRVALAWMVKHENTSTDGMCGGILADDMGLGKSLTVISLVLTNFWDGMPLLKPELGFTRRPLVGGRKKPKRHSRFRRVSAEALGVGKKLGGGAGSSKNGVISNLFKKFRSNNEKDDEGRSTFKFGQKDKIGRNSRIDSDDDEEEDDDDSFIDDDSSDDEISGEEQTQDDGNESSDPEFDPKLNMDGFIDDSDSEDDMKPTRKNVQKRRPYVSDSEDDVEPSKPSSSIKTKKPRMASVRSAVPSVPKSIEVSDSDSSLPDVYEEDAAAPSVGDDKTAASTSSVLPHHRRNEETGLNLIIPPRQPAQRKGRRRATLLVCPTSLISHWLEQLEMHLDKSVNIRVRVHHGATKAKTVEDLDYADIVITTYGTMASEGGMQHLSPLFKVKWLRVVMDEGHSIRNHLTKTAKAAMSLNTQRRWIVTGTPIQNNLMDLWSLVNWLDFGLYAGKANMRMYKAHIERPCKNGDPIGFERLQVLMDVICLRRTKMDKKPDGSMLVELPSKTVLTREVVLSPEDRMCYEYFHKFAADVVRDYQRRGTLLKNYAHVFVLMIRLRQLCCHREMFKEVDWAEVIRNKEGVSKQMLEALTAPEPGKEDVQERLVSQLRELIRSGVSDDCSICLGDLVSPVFTQCGHVFCRACIEQVVDTVKPPTCPLCREVVQKKDLLEAGQDEENEDPDEKIADMEDIIVDISSSKLNAAIKEMLRIRRDQPEDKIIVVSQFTSFLSILHPLLRENQFSTVRLDGTMNHMVRAEVVTAFQSSHFNSPQVLLLSLKAGGVGLNLTAANHLLLLDPAWNPACEWQCFDRTHRMGQTKDVTIYKFITKDSIEEKMLDIQAKKEVLISGAFSLPPEERRKQRLEEIKDIFGI